VTIDPVIAAIIGRSTGVEVFYRINWVPSMEASLTRSFHHASMSFSYQRGVSPGNGLYLTSGRNPPPPISAIPEFEVERRPPRRIYSYASLTQTLGNYSGVNGGGGLTYNLTRAFHFVAGYEYRHYEVEQSTFRRNTYRATIGFGFSPGEVPLSLW